MQLAANWQQSARLVNFGNFYFKILLKDSASESTDIATYQSLAVCLWNSLSLTWKKHFCSVLFFKYTWMDLTQLSKGNKISSGWDQDRKFQTKNFSESFEWMKPGIHSWTCLCTLFYNQATVTITTILLMCVNCINIVMLPLDWVYASVTEVIAWAVSSAVFPGKPGKQVT